MVDEFLGNFGPWIPKKKSLCTLGPAMFNLSYFVFSTVERTFKCFLLDAFYYLFLPAIQGEDLSPTPKVQKTMKIYFISSHVHLYKPIRPAQVAVKKHVN